MLARSEAELGCGDSLGDSLGWNDDTPKLMAVNLKRIIIGNIY